MRPQDVERFTNARINAVKAHQAAKTADEAMEDIRRESAGLVELEGTPIERFDKVWEQLLGLIEPYPLGASFVSGVTNMHIVACPTETGTEDYGIWFNISGQEDLEQPNRRVAAHWVRYGGLERDPADFSEIVVRHPVEDCGEEDPKTMADLANIELTLQAYLESDRAVRLTALT